MTRTAEAALLAAASVLAALGVALVNFAGTGGIDAQVGLTLLFFAAGFGGLHAATRRWAPNASPLLVPLTAIITAAGFAEVYRIDSGLGSDQRWWIIVSCGSAAALLFGLRDTGTAVMRRYRYLLLSGAIGLLLLPLLPESWPLAGAEVNGSRLWVRLDVPFTGEEMSFQPGELAKLLIVAFLASYLAERYRALREMTRTVGVLHLPEPRQLAPVVVAFAASFAVLVYQRDLGASLLLFAVFIAMLFAATARHAYLAAGGLLALAGGFAAVSLFDHVQRRIDAWLRPFDDFFGSGYQVAQGLFAIGSGSLTGSGLGVGRPDLIPAAATDFVFAAFAEEVGFAGAMAILVAYALFASVGLGIALRSHDLFRKLLATGITLVIALQAILIIAGVLRLLPITGIALPFMSYGGSSLLANLLGVALLLRISHEERV